MSPITIFSSSSVAIFFCHWRSDPGINYSPLTPCRARIQPQISFPEIFHGRALHRVILKYVLCNCVSHTFHCWTSMGWLPFCISPLNHALHISPDTSHKLLLLQVGLSRWLYSYTFVYPASFAYHIWVQTPFFVYSKHFGHLIKTELLRE